MIDCTIARGGNGSFRYAGIAHEITYPASINSMIIPGTSSKHSPQDALPDASQSFHSGTNVTLIVNQDMFE